jgi:membrane fusion protein (multidrug efflux system)
VGTKKKIVLALVVVVLIGLSYFIYENYVYVTTDNATIQAHTLMIAPKISGIVTDVMVDENQVVKEGDVLIKIDPRDYANQAALAEADLGSSDARLKDAETNFNRLKSLFHGGAVTQQQFDTASTLYKTETKKNAAAHAQLDQAQLNLAYTEIKAPTNGFIAKRSVEKGQVVPAGQPLLGYVSSESRWVIANFKETDLARIKVGAPAKIEVDSLDGESFSAEVESISPSTGATFSLLPPDNATGNFTKVVQRVPVKIKLKNLKPEDTKRLQVGLSVEVSVRAK